MTEYRYTVDGEKVTLDDIVARCPLVSRQTVSNRVRLGWRTWADLSKRRAWCRAIGARGLGGELLQRI